MIKLGTATTTNKSRRTNQLAGRLILCLLSACDALARRLMPFGLRGQTI
jgi:hypothetical protein